MSRSNKEASVERELKKLAIGAAAMFVLLSAALVVVLGGLASRISVFQEEIVPTEHSVGALLDAMGDVSDRETAVLTANTPDEIDAADDDSRASELARSAAATLTRTLGEEPTDELTQRFDAFVASASDLADVVRTAREVDSALGAGLDEAGSEIEELLALIDDIDGHVQLRYVLLLRELQSAPSPVAVADLVHGRVRIQGERAAAARAGIEILGRRTEGIALTHDRDQLNALASNELAQAIASAQGSLAQLGRVLEADGPEEPSEDAALHGHVEALSTRLEAFVGRVADTEDPGSLVALRHAYFDAMDSMRAVQADGRVRAEEARESLAAIGESAHALATETAEESDTVVRRARIGVALLVVLGVGACFVSARRVLAALRALRQQNADLAALRDELSATNEGLEARVEERTAELAAREASMRLLLDSMGDALFEANAEGTLVGERSRATDDWFGAELERQDPRVWDVLPATPTQRTSLELGWEQLGEGFLPFEVAVDQLPRRFEADGRVFEVEYRESGAGGTLVIARDWTANEAAERAEREAREFQALVGNLLDDREGFEITRTECEALMTQLRRTGDPSEAMKLLHTLKGSTSSYGFSTFASLAHDLEDYVKDEASVPTDDQLSDLATIWHVSIDKLSPYLATTDADRYCVHVDELDRLETFLQGSHSREEILQFVGTWTRVPARSHLGRLQRQAKRVAAGLGKKVEIVAKDHGLRVPDALGPLWPSLIHVVRNAIDHGIETPDVRQQLGKAQTGYVHISTQLQGGDLVIEIVDDGAGVDEERLRASLRTATSSDVVDDLDLLGLLSVDGLSSKETVTEISGRGVGMAAVVSTVRELGGRIEVKTELGKGTRVRIAFPDEDAEFAQAA